MDWKCEYDTVSNCMAITALEVVKGSLEYSENVNWKSKVKARVLHHINNFNAPHLELKHWLLYIQLLHVSTICLRKQLMSEDLTAFFLFSTLVFYPR